MHFKVNMLTGFTGKQHIIWAFQEWILVGWKLLVNKEAKILCSRKMLDDSKRSNNNDIKHFNKITK